MDYNYIGEDILVLAGDIHTRNRHHELIEQVPTKVKIVLVMGNHSVYHSVFEDVVEYMQSLETRFPNFTFLNNSSAVIKNIHFYGGMMCSDFSLYGEGHRIGVEQEATMYINDFKLMQIQDDMPCGYPRKWTVNDHKKQHKLFVEGLEKWLDETKRRKRRIVISHFSPTERTTAPRFIGDRLTPYFTANMEKYMTFKGLWLFGHTHDSADIMCGDVRVMANPRGYKGENVRMFDPNMLIEV